MAGEAFSAYVRFFCKDDVSPEVQQMRKKAKDASQDLDKLADSAGKKLKDGFTKAKTAAANLGRGMAAIGAGVTAAGAALFGLSMGTEQYQANMGKLETAFADQGKSLDSAKGAYKGFMGILGDSDQAVEATNHLAELCKTQDQLNDWTTIGAGVYAKFGNSLPLEGLTEAANETAKVGTVTGPLADALNWAGISEDKFNEKLAKCSSESERAALITETLTKEYGAAGAKYQEVNKDLIASRQAQADFADAMARVGEVVRPITTAITEIGASLINKAMPHLQSFAQWFQEKMPAIKEAVSQAFGYISDGLLPPLEAAFGFLAETVLPPVQAAFKWFLDNLPAIVPVVVGIATAFFAYGAITSIISAVSAIIAVVRNGTLLWAAAQKVLNLVMSINPLGLVIALIAGLVAAIVVAWNTSETFREVVTKAWNAIKSVATKVFSGIASFLKSVWSGIKNTASAAWSKISSAVGNAIAKVKSVINGVKGVIDGLASKFQAVKDKVASAVGAMRDAVKRAIDKIKGLFKIKLKFPDIKLPHFKIKGGKAPFGFGGKGEFPSVSVSWYRKGGIFDAATLLPTSQGFAGVGEAGPEAVAPISELMKYVRAAVAEANVGGGYVANVSVTTGETDPHRLAAMIERRERRAARRMGWQH